MSTNNVVRFALLCNLAYASTGLVAVVEAEHDALETIKYIVLVTSIVSASRLYV
jgi:hypothetical protein